MTETIIGIDEDMSKSSNHSHLINMKYIKKHIDFEFTNLSIFNNKY